MVNLSASCSVDKVLEYSQIFDKVLEYSQIFGKVLEYSQIFDKVLEYSHLGPMTSRDRNHRKNAASAYRTPFNT
jgi:hypothetical protein